MVIELNDVVVANDGQPVQGGETLAKFLSNALFSAQKGDSLKYLDWSLSLYKGEGLILDNSDLDHLIEFTKNASIMAGFKGQILRKLTSYKA